MGNYSVCSYAKEKYKKGKENPECEKQNSRGLRWIWGNVASPGPPEHPGKRSRRLTRGPGQCNTDKAHSELSFKAREDYGAELYDNMFRISSHKIVVTVRSASFAHSRASIEEPSQSPFHLLISQCVDEGIKGRCQDSIEERDELPMAVGV